MPTGLELLEASIAAPEPIIDAAYEKEYFIITRSTTEVDNELIVANKQIIDLITAYGVAQKQGIQETCDRCIHDMVPLLATSDINNSEFTSYWEVNDVSYSMFSKMSNEKKKQFLHEITKRFLAERHSIYQSHGYSVTTLQVKADSFAHKRSGSLGRRKVVTVFEEYDIKHVDDPASADDRFYMLPDGGDKNAFDRLLEARGVRFEWRNAHAGKYPDFALVIGDALLIVEHKHMKELGGGQDKQVVEISDFVNYSEDVPNIHYVAFLDGVLFNKLFCVARTRGKISTQRDQIKDNLETNPGNYFVNTAGFHSLLQSLLDGVEQQERDNAD